MRTPTSGAQGGTQTHSLTLHSAPTTPARAPRIDPCPHPRAHPTPHRSFAARPEVMQYAYVPAGLISQMKDATFPDDTVLAIHAPVGTSCEIPHPEDGLASPDCRYQIFVMRNKRQPQGSVHAPSPCPVPPCLPHHAPPIAHHCDILVTTSRPSWPRACPVGGQAADVADRLAEDEE